MSTATKVLETPVGTLKCQFYAIDLTGSDTSINIKTGLTSLVFACFVNEITEAQGLIHRNFSDAGSTAYAGAVNISGCTAADNGMLMVLGN